MIQQRFKWHEDADVPMLHDADHDKVLGWVTEIKHTGKWAAHVPGLQRCFFDSKHKAIRVVEQYVRTKFG
jgi:hypothetical protein